MSHRQRTVRDEISCTGIGLHSGKKVKLTIKPSPPDSGIRFIRKDISAHRYIKAHFDNVVDTNMSTTIGNNSVVHPFCEIRNSLIMDDIHIGANSFISHSIIGRGSIIENNFSSISGKTTIEIEREFKKLKSMGTMIGEDCTIGSHVVVDPGIMIGRKCKIDPMKRIRKKVSSESKVM